MTEDINISEEITVIALNEYNELIKELKEKKTKYIKGKKVIPNNLAGDIIFKDYNPETASGINRGFLVIHDKTEDIYRYDAREGIYKDDGLLMIAAIVSIILDDKASKHWIFEVIAAVRRFLDIRIRREDLNNTGLVALKNCLYNPKTKEILKFDKKYHITNKLNIDYDEKAECPKILKFLSEIHNENDISIIQELFGYCLYPKYEYHNIFFFIGNGRNGKSTELSLLRRFIGDMNVSSVSIHDLINCPFMSAQLFGKLANISADIGMTRIKDAGIIKQLSGNDKILGQHKFGQPFEFINYAKLIYACNEPPIIDDRSDAIWSRMIHITFPNTFIGEKADPKIIDKISTKEELSGLFNWAMIGLNRLITNGKFSYSKTTEENIHEYDRKSNQILAFVEDCLEFSEDSYEEKEAVYKKYIEWAKINKTRVVANNKFPILLKDTLPGIYDTRKMVNNNRINIYMRVMFKGTEGNSIEDTTQQNNETPQTKIEDILKERENQMESLQDKINNIKNGIEYNGGSMSIDDLYRDFGNDIIDKCIYEGILIKLPNGNIGIG